MKHEILVLHFGAQCPWYRWVIEQAHKAAEELRAFVAVKDVMDHPKLAEQYKMFFPSMTVIDGTIRVPPPVGAEKLVQMAKGTTKPKPTSPMAYGKRASRCVIQALRPDNIGATIPLCITGVEPIAAREKAHWTKEMLKKSGCPLLGFIAFSGGQAKGAVEFLPSSWVPYPLPRKDHAIAFITCIYPTKPDVDYKSPVLERLWDHLSEEGYRELQVVAGRRTPFPNGPAAFFHEHGFVELGEVDCVGLADLGEEELILMGKKL